MHRGAHEFRESFQYYHWYLQGKMCRADIVLAVYWSRQTQHGRRLLQCHKENGRRFVYSYCIVWFLHCLWCSETVSCVVCLTSARQAPTLTPQREWKKVCILLLYCMISALSLVFRNSVLCCVLDFSSAGTNFNATKRMEEILYALIAWFLRCLSCSETVSCFVCLTPVKVRIVLVFQGGSSSCMFFSSSSDGQIALPRVADMYEILGRFLKDLGLLSQVSGGLMCHVLFPFLSLLDGKGV